MFFFEAFPALACVVASSGAFGHQATTEAAATAAKGGKNNDGDDGDDDVMETDPAVLTARLVTSMPRWKDRLVAM
jgi:hypothetical protein